MSARAVPIPPPTVGQLKTGEWVVLNMEHNDALWEATFGSRREACEALAKHFIARKLEGDR